MPITKTNTTNAIRGLPSKVTQAMRSDSQNVIAQFAFADIGRGAGTLHTSGSARLDMQGKTSAGDYNFQVQIGDFSVAAVLVASSVLSATDPGNQRGTASAVISALNQSLDSGTVWSVTGKLP